MESLGSFLGDSWEIIWTFLKIIWRFVGDSFGDFSEILLWRREEVEGGAGEGLARGEGYFSYLSIFRSVFERIENVTRMKCYLLSTPSQSIAPFIS